MVKDNLNLILNKIKSGDTTLTIDELKSIAEDLNVASHVMYYHYDPKKPHDVDADKDGALSWWIGQLAGHNRAMALHSETKVTPERIDKIVSAFEAGWNAYIDHVESGSKYALTPLQFD